MRRSGEMDQSVYIRGNNDCMHNLDLLPKRTAPARADETRWGCLEISDRLNVIRRQCPVSG
jgi:hypothetical protein